MVGGIFYNIIVAIHV